jgi:Rhomboid family
MASLGELSARPVSREAVEVLRERDTARSGDRVNPNAGQPRRVPVLTATALTATLLGTLTRPFGPGVFDALRRDPKELGHGQLWRLLTPVLVQSDHPLLAIIGVFVLCAVIGVAGEWLLPRSEWLLLYLLGALAGHGIGETFQPHQSGASVAFAGILGGLAARILLDHDPRLKFWRIRFAALIPLAILDTALRDIHGAPFLVGFAVGSAFELRGRVAIKQSVLALAAQEARDGG